MTSSVAPLADGVGIASIGDRRPRHEPDEQRRPKPTPADHHTSFDRPLAQGAESTETPPPPADEPLVPAETLFATALFANALLRYPPSPTEMQLRTAHGWQPPDSMLRLKDKTI